MSEQIESLWPDVIRASVQSPASILTAQAEALAKQTSGVLVGKVTAGYAEDKMTLLYFDVVAPDLDDYKHRIMVVQQRAGMYYPAVIDAELFRSTGLAGISQAFKSMPLFIQGIEQKEDKPVNRADNDKEFISLVSKILRSPYVVSVAQSLIARVSEVRAGKKVEALPSGADSTGAQEPGTGQADGPDDDQ